jgi:hypothetical protein
VARGYIGTAVVGGSAATALCVLVVIATTPLAIGPTGVTLWFLSLIIALSCWVSLISFGLEKRLSEKVKNKELVRNAWRRGLFAGGYITVLLALSSLKQLNVRDAVLFSLLILLIEFYMVMRG